jgi:tRNA threonylcarbamoyladenosine biosynthesis protein TsaB
MPNLILIKSASSESFVALYADGKLNVETGTSDNLISCLDSLVRQFPEAIRNVDAISVVTGPGSFTGIRVGIAIAKGIALALQKKIIPVTSFQVALNRIENPEPLRKYCVLLPAKLPEYYYGIIQDGKELARGVVNALEVDSIIGREIIAVGGEELLTDKSVRPAMSKSEFDSMLELSIKYFEEGKVYPPENIEPLYIKEFAVKSSV